MKDYKETTIAYNNLISTTLVKSFARDKESDNYAETDDMAQLLKSTEYVAYAYAYDLKTGKIFWSTEPSFWIKQKIMLNQIFFLQ